MGPVIKLEFVALPLWPPLHPTLPAPHPLLPLFLLPPSLPFRFPFPFITGPLGSLMGGGGQGRNGLAPG